ncbi:peroxiredoxin [Sphingomonas sp. MMS24-J13]|uniref:peroxiredoxin n=1 Tax=Sphingomonas sp. MMS24-J13 TaxID=3238686 RepID=UPI0038514C9B
MPVRGLTIVLASADTDRLRSALGMAATQAALGGAARLFFDGAAVRLLTPPLANPRDDDHRAVGLPTLGELIETAFTLGVSIMACQSGLALAGLAADRIDPRIATGGMTVILASLGEDRLVAL